MIESTQNRLAFQIIRMLIRDVIVGYGYDYKRPNDSTFTIFFKGRELGSIQANRQNGNSYYQSIGKNERMQQLIKVLQKKIDEQIEVNNTFNLWAN